MPRLLGWAVIKLVLSGHFKIINSNGVTKMLIDLVAGTIDKLSKEISEAGPAEKERLVRSTVALLEVFTEELKNKVGAVR